MDIGGLVYAFFNNAGPGGVAVLLVFGVACTTYFFLTRWIVSAGIKDESATSEENSESTDA